MFDLFVSFGKMTPKYFQKLAMNLELVKSKGNSLDNFICFRIKKTNLGCLLGGDDFGGFQSHPDPVLGRACVCACVAYKGSGRTGARCLGPWRLGLMPKVISAAWGCTA